MNNKIKDLALNAIVKNISSEAWIFTDDELESFGKSLVKECAEVAWCNFHADGSAIFKLLHEHFGLQDLEILSHDTEDLVYRLQKRAEIRRQIPGRKSVLEGKPDRISDLLEEAAIEIQSLRKQVANLKSTS